MADRRRRWGRRYIETIAQRLGVSQTAVCVVRQAMPLPPPGQIYLVFPGREGDMRHHPATWRSFKDLQRKVRMVRPDEEPKYSLHDLRHFFVSWAIKHGKYQPKELQAVMGHSSIEVTYDVYGHLFSDPEDAHARVARMERALLERQRLQQKPAVLQTVPLKALKHME